MKKKYLSIIAAITLLTGVVAGCSPDSSPSTTTPATTSKSQDYDVVVVGGGAAGLTAAITAAEEGATVALLEKLSFVGGSTMLSGGIVYGVNSEIHKSAGIEDSPEDLASYWHSRAQEKNDLDFLKFVAEHSGETIDWIVERGVKFGEPYPTGTSPVKRAVSTDNGGAGIITPLKEHAEAKGVEFFLETPVKELVLSDGVVTGVKATLKDGEEKIFKAKSVILTTGGFDHNEDLMKEYASRSLNHHSFASVGNTGDGLLMAKDAGAQVISNGGTIGFRRVKDEPSYTTPVSSLMWMPYLYVNSNGERFVNETIDYPIFYEELIKQPEQISYLIFDANTYVETLDDAVAKGVAYKSETLAELAQAMNVDPATFESTVETYNTMIAGGEDTAFGKDLTDHKPINSPAYYALAVEPAILGTMSGVKINLDTQVLNGDDEPIKGLYAAGELANGSFFNLEYPASGTSIQMSLTFGRIAGSKAAANK